MDQLYLFVKCNLILRRLVFSLVTDLHLFTRIQLKMEVYTIAELSACRKSLK